MSIDDTLTFVTRPPRRVRRDRRLILLIAAITVAVLALGGALVSCTEFEEAQGAEQEQLPPGLPQPDPIILEPEGGPTGQTGAGQPEPVPIDEVEEGGSAQEGPCPGVLADGLVITPNPVKLISTKGAIDIKNCDTEAVDWTASSVAWVTLAESGGNLPSGAVFRLLFTVKTTSLPTGPYSFTIEVNDIDVPVSGTKLGGFVAPGGTTPPVPTVGGLIAPGISPCATKCILKALLSTLPGRADISLDVRTNTPAKIVVQVDTREPSYSNDGDPYYTNPQLKFATPDRRSQWTTVLTPLQPETKYHIVVAAQDAQGGSSFQTGTFKTPKVINQIAGNEPGGCSTGCVRSALLKPRLGGPDVDIEVRTHVPTKLQVLANGQTIAGTDGAFVTEWDSVLTLQPGTKYDITLKVTDEQGRTQQHTAVVNTPEPPASHLDRVLVTFHEVLVRHDGDDTIFNRTGELRFRFEVNGQRVIELDTGERKVKAPERVSLDDGDRDSGRSVIIENAPDVLPIRVQAQERDSYGGPTDYCAAGSPMFPETSGRTVVGDCIEVEWNTAEGAIELSTQAGGALPPCYGFPDGVRGDMCVALGASGEDPEFDVYITIDFLS
jgi:hypothetical protein